MPIEVPWTPSPSRARSRSSAPAFCCSRRWSALRARRPSSSTSSRGRRSSPSSVPASWIGLRERERGEPARHGRLWALGAVLSFTGLGWSWTGDAPRVLSPGVCFLGAVVCAVGAVVSARRARHADPRERAVARAAAWVAVLLLLIPVFLLGLLILLLRTSDSPFFTWAFTSRLFS